MGLSFLGHACFHSHIQDTHWCASILIDFFLKVKTFELHCIMVTIGASKLKHSLRTLSCISLGPLALQELSILYRESVGFVKVYIFWELFNTTDLHVDVLRERSLF